MCIYFGNCDKCSHHLECKLEELRYTFDICGDFQCTKSEECKGHCLGLDEDYDV